MNHIIRAVGMFLLSGTLLGCSSFGIMGMYPAYQSDYIAGSYFPDYFCYPDSYYSGYYGPYGFYYY